MESRSHIILSRPFDLARFERDSRDDRCPRHAMSLLRDALGARVHQPGEAPVSVTDRLLSRLPGVGSAHQWALARKLGSELSSDDVVFTR